MAAFGKGLSLRVLATLGLSLPFALCLAACGPVSPSIGRIDSLVKETKRKQDVMAAVSLPIGPLYSYPAGTEVIVRSDQSGIRKIELTAFGDMGKTEENYYYRNEELAYCERRVWRYDRPGGEMSGVEINGYYFKNDRLFGAIDLITRKRRPASVQLAAEGPPFIERAYFFLRVVAGGK